MLPADAAAGTYACRPPRRLVVIPAADEAETNLYETAVPISLADQILIRFSTFRRRKALNFRYMTKRRSITSVLGACPSAFCTEVVMTRPNLATGHLTPPQVALVASIASVLVTVLALRVCEPR